jgi:hypothetical protein
MENKDIYKSIAKSLNAWSNCVKSNNKEWEDKHEERISELINELPHGSGLDGEWSLDFEKSNDKQLTFYMQYHCMNENGMYDGYVDFTLKVKASLQFDVDLFITGNFGKYQDVKEYLYDILN